jgi:hypothetical protein
VARVVEPRDPDLGRADIAAVARSESQGSGPPPRPDRNAIGRELCWVQGPADAAPTSEAKAEYEGETEDAQARPVAAVGGECFSS